MRFRFGVHLLDTERRELWRSGEPVAVEPQVFDLVVYLVENRERVVARDDLIARVWGGRIVSEATIDSRINAARRAVGDSGAAQAVIRTFARKGVRFVAELSPEPAASLSHVVERPQRAAGERAAVTPPLPDKPSIAVLAFANLSSDPEQEFFADGVAEDIITALSRYPSLFVIARNSSFTYKGQTVDIRELGRELGVRYVLEGSLRKAGNRVRVTAQLIEAESSNHLWAERYDRDLDDIFAVQDEITTAVTTAIAPAIAEAEQQRALRRPPHGLDAWTAYQRGMWYFSKDNAEDNARAEELFRRAVALDANFAGGYIGLARAINASATTYFTRDVTEARQTCEELSRRAIALDPGNADPFTTLSTALMQRGDFAGALAEAERALALNPNWSPAHGTRGQALLWSGRVEEALPALRRCIELDPRNHRIVVMRRMQIAIGQYLSRHYEAAIEAAHETIRLQPDHRRIYQFLAMALAQLDRVEEAREALATALEVAPEAFANWVPRRRLQYRPEDYDHMIDGLRKAGWDG